MSEVIREMIINAAKEDYVEFSELVSEHIEAKMKDRLSEEVAEIQSELFEKRGENKEKTNTGKGEGDIEQDGPRDEFNDKPGGDETKHDKGGKKVKNKMKTEQNDDDDDYDDDDMKKEQDDDEDDDGDDEKKPNPFAKKNGDDKGKKPNPFAKKNGKDSDDEDDNDDEPDADDKIKDEKKGKK